MEKHLGFVLNLYRKSHFVWGKKSVLFLEKTKHSGNFGAKTKMKIWPKIFPLKLRGNEMKK